MQYMKTQKGFTLLELMVTVSIVAIVLSLAAPSARDIMDNAESKAGLRNISSALSLARSEAVNRHAVVSVCSVNLSRTACGNLWSSGFIVFQDVDADGTIDVGTDTIIRIFDEMGQGVSLTRSMRNGTADNGFIRYNETAMLVLESEASNFVICDDRGTSQAKGIVLNASGQVRVATDTTNNQIIDIPSQAGANIVSQDVTCP